MKLTKNELVYIDDKITFRDIWEGEKENSLIIEETFRPLVGSALIGVPESFIYKISKALIECIDKKIEEVEIELNFYEIALLREIAISNVKIGDEPVGINLKIKIMREIIKNEEQEEINEEDENIEEIDINALKVKRGKKEKNKEEIKELLNKWRENDNTN